MLVLFVILVVAFKFLHLLIQGETDRVCLYTLHISDLSGMSGGGEMKNISLENDETLMDGGNLIFNLTANRNLSVNIEIESSAGMTTVLSDAFSKLSVKNFYMIIHQL